MSAVHELRREVASALGRAGVSAGDVMAVACSYGPDSLALADALLALRPGGLLTLVHVDHGLRPDAWIDAERVRAFAAARGVAAVVVPVTVVPAGEGLEAAARAARHEALARVAGEVGARWVALAHTASDQTETVLHRLVRGAGTAGLAGIAPVRGLFVRPLLRVSRPLVEAYLTERSLTASRDAMNEDRRFLRVRLRKDVLPALRRENPALDAAVGRAAAAVRELDQALDWMADRLAPKEGPLAAADLADLPPPVSKRLLARRAHALGARLEARHLEALLAFAIGSRHGSAALALPGLEARREYGVLHLVRPEDARAPLPEVEVVEEGPAAGPYLVRRWQPGDRMRPAALGGHSRKLQDLFTDRKVSARARRAAVIVVRERDGEIVWAEHVGPSFGERLQVTLTRRDPPVIYD